MQGLMLCRRTKSCAAWSSTVAFFGDVLPASTDMPPAGICGARNGSDSNSARNGFLDTGRVLGSVRGDGRAGEGRAGDAAPRLRKGLFEGRSSAKPGEGLRSNSARDQDGSEWQKRSAKLRYVFGTGWAWETWKRAQQGDLPAIAGWGANSMTVYWCLILAIPRPSPATTANKDVSRWQSWCESRGVDAARENPVSTISGSPVKRRLLWLP